MDVRRAAVCGFALMTAIAAATPETKAQAGRGGGPSARWVGQDGKDFVGPHNRIEPSDVQDVHIALAGLDPRREVAFVDVTATEGEHNGWQYNATDPFAWKAVLVREKGSPRADLYIEPSGYSAPRKHDITIRYDDGREHRLSIQGRRTDASLRTSVATLKAEWADPKDRDVVGPGPEVGPDGVVDARLRLTGVSTKVGIRGARIDGPDGLKWESHINPAMHPACEYHPDPAKPGEGDLFFQPTRRLDGGPLAVRLLYDNDTGDRAAVAAGRFDPSRKPTEPPDPAPTFAKAEARWLGQDGRDPIAPGDVHVAILGPDLPRVATAATMADSNRGAWLFEAAGKALESTPEWRNVPRMAVEVGAGLIDVFFPPSRDGRDSIFTLRLIDRDGRSTIVRFPGGPCDPALRLPAPASTRADARPGDDLQALVDAGGTVTLAPGTYRLNRTLTLRRPTVLTAPEGATLIFSQPADSAPWTTAIKIHKGRTTINGLTIRFEGPIRWDGEVGYGPAVIGSSDNRDPDPFQEKRDLVLSRLDVEAPPNPDPGRWADAVKAARFTNAESGRVEDCTILAGPIEFFSGPWTIRGNTFRGAPTGTMSSGAITGHFVVDLTVKGNRAKPEPSGKLWRFLVATHTGRNVTVEDNVVEGVGEMDGDGVPRVNAPEVMLTESYRINYEGFARPITADGQVVRIGEPQGEPIRAGMFAALLTGPAAGTYRRVAQPLDATTILLDAPIPSGTDRISIADGFDGLKFVGNTIDVRGSSTSYGLILPGDHFGTVVERNTFLGGARGVASSACPSESPVHWGWSHCPAMAMTVRGNTFQDVRESLALGVSHDPKHVKFNKNRVYMSATVDDNVIRWTDPFLRRIAAERPGKEDDRRPLLGIVLGELHSRDPGELQVQAARNTLDAPAGRRTGPSLLVRAAVVNGKPVTDGRFELPPAR